MFLVAGEAEEREGTYIEGVVGQFGGEAGLAQRFRGAGQGEQIGRSFADVAGQHDPLGFRRAAGPGRAR